MSLPIATSGGAIVASASSTIGAVVGFFVVLAFVLVALRMRRR